MKKYICFFSLFVFLIFSSFAYADNNKVLSFQDIQWLSNDEETISKMKENGLINSAYSGISYNNTGKYILNDNMEFFWIDLIEEYKDYCYSASFCGSVKGKIAGYPIKDIIISFAYDGDFHLISVEVKVLGADYNQLKDKISKVYGEAETVSIEEEEIVSNIWKGEDNSAIVLYKHGNDLDYSLMYGRIDAAEILANCRICDQDDVSGL